MFGAGSCEEIPDTQWRRGRIATKLTEVEEQSFRLGATNEKPHPLAGHKSWDGVFNSTIEFPSDRQEKVYVRGRDGDPF